MDDQFSRRDFLRTGVALGAGVAFGGLLAACDGKKPAPDHSADNKPRRGGRIRLGIVDGDQAGNLDAHKPTGTGSTIRGFALYSKLWEWSDDMLPQLALAEFAEPNADASSWTVRLQPGLEFHHGKTISADDVIFSILRLSDPQLASPYASYVSSVDRQRLEKLDSRTVRIHLKPGKNFLALPETWVNFGGIVPTDYHPVTNPVGAGPYRLKDFRPGQRTLFTRFENYFRSERPYPDELELLEFKDQTMRFMALLSGQIHMANALAPEQAVLFKGNDRASLLVSKSYAWRSFNLNTAQAPFNDVRVRQAFRLLVDREEMVKRVLNGQGRIANDLYAPHDPAFNHDIPQRSQDLAEARRLLREAGIGKLSLELVCNGAGSSSAQVLAEQARLVDIDIRIKQVDNATFNGPDKNKWALSTGGTLGQPFLATAHSTDGPSSVANRSNFHDPEFSALIEQAQREPLLEKRRPLVHAAQRIQHERGGLLIWGFADTLDGISPAVGGIHAERSQFPTWRFDRLWLKEGAS